MQDLDHRDRDLLDALQSEIPLASTPFAILGQQIDMSEKEVLKRTDRLKKEGAIRQISAVFDPRACGYRSSLVAARVDDDRIDHAAAIISAHPGVYQNYRRNHEFNLWFTIAVPPTTRIGLERTVEVLGHEAQCEAIRLLPALRTFRASAHDAADPAHEDAGPGDETAGSAPTLTEREIELVRLLQKDLPLHPRPFDVLGRTAGFSGDDILESARGFASRQQLRRFAALVQPRRSSFTASVMGVWRVPAGKVDTIAPRMAAHRAVSQCYLRPTYEDWPYNVFTIVHGRSVDECEAVLGELAGEIGLDDMRALFPVKEFKRSRLAFFSPENDAWEAARLDQAAANAVS